MEVVIRFVGSLCEFGAFILVARSLAKGRRSVGLALPWDRPIAWFRRKFGPQRSVSTSIMATTGTINATATVGTPTVSTEPSWEQKTDSERIASLKRQLENLVEGNERVHLELRTDLRRLEERVIGSVDETSRRQEQLRQDLEAEKKGSLQVDWRALPLILLGLTLTTWSEEIACLF